MYTKIIIRGNIEVLTGMHIGGSSDFSAIGAIDSPVVRDTLSKLPIIPGSTLKGKLRYLLAKYLNGGILTNNPNEDKPEVIRLFGNSADSMGSSIVKARLKFNDSFLSNYDELYNKRVSPTEVKFENTISRRDSVAMPRQIERVIRGSIFDFEIFYELSNLEHAVQDFTNIKMAFNLLEYDYLGGHGTRGSGRIKFNDLQARIVVGECIMINYFNKILGEPNEI